MPERFTVARMEALLKLKPVTAAGREFIDKALAAPSRNVQGTTQNVASDLPCPKMWGSAQAESWSAENPFTLEHIFNDETVGYTNQVPRIWLTYKGRNGRTVRTPYTADCLSLNKQQGAVVEEWKPESDRGELEDKYPGRYVREDDGTYSSPAINVVLNPLGITFVVRFSDEVTSIGHRNRRYLYKYLQPNAAEHYLAHVPTLLEVFGDRPSATYSDLVDSGADIDVLNWSIAQGRLHVDLDAAVLTSEKHLVQVFRHAETLKAWQLAVRPDGSRPSSPASAPNYDLRPGDVFLFDGQRLTVTVSGATAVYTVTARGEHLTIDHGVLVSAHRAGKVTLPDRWNADAQSSRFWRAGTANLERAIRRVGVLEKVDAGDDIPLADRYSGSTLRRWRRLIREGEAKGISPVEALIDEGDLRGFHGSHIAEDLSDQINEMITEAISGKLSKSLRTIYFDIKAAVEADGQRMIVKSSFYERTKKLKSVKTVRDSQGHKAAYPITPTYWMLEKATPVHCERAMELVHFDSTLLDVELRSSISGEVLGRPWLSLAVCAHTRRVVGMYLSFKPPSYVSSMMLLADIVKRMGRLPDSIIHDWGSEFKAKDFKYALTALFVTRHVRPKSAPRFGSILERMFGVVTRQVIDNIAGNTKLRKNVRQLSPQADPTVHSGLWLADLYQGLEDYFFNLYDNEKHSTTLHAPRSMFDASFIAHGARPHRLRRYEELLTVLMPTAKGRPRLIDPSRGVYVNYRYYGHPLLANLALGGSTAVVKPLPFDPGSVLVFMKGQWLICRAGMHEDLRGAPEVVRRCLFEEWTLEQRLVEQSHDGSREKLRELLERLNQKALENKEVFRDREARALMAPATFPVAEAAAKPSASLNKLETMMAEAIAAALKSPSVGRLVEENQ
jgi:putative transposase